LYEKDVFGNITIRSCESYSYLSYQDSVLVLAKLFISYMSDVFHLTMLNSVEF